MRIRFKVRGSRFKEQPPREGEQGYMLLGALVAVALVMIALSAAFTAEAFSLRREREVESARRANQYVRAIREYYLKFQQYPASIKALENTNNIRFLRQRYVDPLTGKADYRLIVVGQNKTTVKGFFGEPLSGLPGSGPGAGLGLGPSGTTAAGTGTAGAAGIAANGAAGAAVAGAGGPGGFAGGFGAGGAGSNGASQEPAASGVSGTSAPGTQSSGSGASGPGSNLGPIMGVGSSATGNSIITVNEQTSYQTWEFLYDPRIEKLKAAAALNAGAQSGASGGNPVGIGGSSAPTSTIGAPGSGGTGTGTAPAGGGQPTQP